MTDSSATPVRIAIVGAGPAGFYAAATLLGNDDLGAEVTLIDRLPTPFGLVRAGVAPDHPKIKNVIKKYEKTAQHERFTFLGGVEVGRDVSYEELAETHHAVLYTTGMLADRRLGIPGEDLPGSVAATDFVAWYNGHPDYADHEFDLSGKRAVVIGNGNVAIDVARMLALAPSELGATDTADHAIEALNASSIEEIVVLGRRGPAQAAFTNPELRELGEMEIADVLIQPGQAELDETSRTWLDRDGGDAREKKNVQMITDYAEHERTDKPRRVVLRFLGSPVEITGDERVEGIRIVRNEIVDEGDGYPVARPTSDVEDLECSLVLRSIGYRGTPIPGVPYDEDKQRISNLDGRITEPESGDAVPGQYTAGWIKRGPSGIIGTNKKCANDTVGLLLEDHAAGTLPTPQKDAEELYATIRERRPEALDWAAWRKLDEHEVGLGEPQGRPRVKVTSLEEMFEAAGTATTA